MPGQARHDERGVSLVTSRTDNRHDLPIPLHVTPDLIRGPASCSAQPKESGMPDQVRHEEGGWE